MPSTISTLQENDMSGVVTAAAVGGAALAVGGTAMTIGTAAAIGLGAGAMKNQYDQGKAAQAAGEKSLQQQQAAQTQNVQAAEAQASQSQQAMNRANQATPDTAAIMAGAGNKPGGTTLLTGAGGVDPNALMLGKNTLLGG